MANAKNLKPNAARTEEELRAMGSKGGKASAEARKKRKLTKELARQVLAMQPKISKKTRDELLKMGYEAEAEGAPTVELVGLCAIAKLYMAGNQSAGKFLYEYAQIADLRTQLERERIKAMKEAKQPAAESHDDPLAALLTRIDAEAAGAGGAP